MMGRQSGIILILSALVAFFLPLVGRMLWQQYQPLLTAGNSQQQTLSDRPPPDLPPARYPWPNAQSQEVARANFITTQPFAQESPAPQMAAANPRNYGQPVENSDFLSNSLGENSGQKEIAAPMWGQLADPLESVKPTLIKLGLASLGLLTVCLVCFKLGTPMRFGRQVARQLQVEDSISLSRDAGVKLICVGNQKLVVGHDRRGLQSLVLLPQQFEEFLTEKDPPVDGKSTDRYADSIRSALTNPEDDGWDLNRRIS